MNGEQIHGHPHEVDAQQAEEFCYRYMMIGGGLLLVGFVLLLTTVLFWVGIPVAAVGAAIIAGNIVWYLRLRKQQGINVACPSCSKEYNVLPGVHNFICDECKHVVPVPHAA